MPILVCFVSTDAQHEDRVVVVELQLRRSAAACGPAGSGLADQPALQQRVDPLRDRDP